MLTSSTLLPKLILQDLWKSHFSWEEELPFTFVDKFSKWLNEMYLLKDVTLPRFMNLNETSELHVFVDACKGAYAACVFVRSEVEGESETHSRKEQSGSFKIFEHSKVVIDGLLHRSKTC
ncbi:hypothetical protein AVEN_98460-1 [Araneus ventricosus]|uniref:Uncharacterized protein n=1 Tax=Araneus ventricosus TaxID=182803 RepID=A0A4Y2RXX9_ARAVE|nr:hypothetical protein AVEN_98460-1 [Araneus ventricosus]